MIIKREKYFVKKVNIRGQWDYDQQKVKRISYWLFGIIPLYIGDVILEGEYER